jgi:hypothetical protein
MPSDIAKQIVNQIYGDEKAKSIDSVADALGSLTYDAIQARKVEFAKSMGFDLDDTAQGVADDIEGEMTDGTDTEPEEVEVDERQPHEPPQAEHETEEPEEQTDETDS